ncbi:MAG: IgGFc-binding protein, partial [Myxococcales bacterium]|nr:IgGFc-binding protein [Polyangiaceae bacterium]MDW8251744.1 IgGFc-binding protein [Myxococcales bacterium]
GVFSFVLNQGDVVQVLSDPNTDPAGSLVQADKPVQVIGGISCANIPDTNTQACDHLEETVLPAETLGKRYLVAPPTGPKGNTPGHVVRLVGNVNGTKLTYKGQPPLGAPTTINAGQVVQLGLVQESFEIEGDHEFIVSTFMPGANLLDPNALQEAKGDPSMSTATAIEQFRKSYVFLAPDDYDISYADVLAPEGTSLTLDGQAVTVAPDPIQGTGYVVFRIKLGPGQGGAHQIIADKEVGLQVMGYGSYTSYQYPGGSNLTLIAPPPPKINLKVSHPSLPLPNP